LAVKYLETRSFALDDLTPLDRNPRRGNVEMIRESIRANTQYKSLVVRKTADALVILTGNHTFEALKEEGRAEARCEVLECSDDEATRIVLADNRTADTAVNDDEVLLELLETLDDLDGSGYTMDDLEDLLAAADKIQETPYQSSSASYSESPLELAQRTEYLGELKSAESKGIRETVVILPQDQHDELHRLLRALRKPLGDDLTNGEVVLRSVRAMALLAAERDGGEPASRDTASQIIIDSSAETE